MTVNSKRSFWNKKLEKKSGKISAYSVETFTSFLYTQKSWASSWWSQERQANSNFRFCLSSRGYNKLLLNNKWGEKKLRSIIDMYWPFLAETHCGCWALWVRSTSSCNGFHYGQGSEQRMILCVKNEKLYTCANPTTQGNAPVHFF